MTWRGRAGIFNSWGRATVPGTPRQQGNSRDGSGTEKGSDHITDLVVDDLARESVIIIIKRTKNKKNKRAKKTQNKIIIIIKNKKIQKTQKIQKNTHTKKETIGRG